MSRMGDIAVAIQEWAVSALLDSNALETALGEDSREGLAGRIWDSPPPADAVLPYVLLNVVEPRDIGGVGFTEVMAVAELTAKVVGAVESYDPLAPIVTAMHAALHGRANVPLNGSGTMLSSRRVRQIAYPEVTEGIEYRHLGGAYEVHAQ